MNSGATGTRHPDAAVFSMGRRLSGTSSSGATISRFGALATGSSSEKSRSSTHGRSMMFRYHSRYGSLRRSSRGNPTRSSGRPLRAITGTWVGIEVDDGTPLATANLPTFPRFARAATSVCGTVKCSRCSRAMEQGERKRCINRSRLHPEPGFARDRRCLAPAETASQRARKAHEEAAKSAATAMKFRKGHTDYRLRTDWCETGA